MLGKKISFKKLAKKVKVMTAVAAGESNPPCQQESLLKEVEDASTNSPSSTPTGYLALYIGEDRERFLVPTGYLSHPLFKMLLEKAYNEFGFQQTNGLVVPCSASTFREVVNAVENSNGKFDFGKLVEEFV